MMPIFPALLLLQASQDPNFLRSLLFQVAAFIAIFYFIIIRPQQRQRKTHEQTLGALKRGDRIVTAGGIVGEVVHVKESGTEGAKAATDEVTIRSGESRLIVERGRIAKIVTASGATSSAPQQS